ncbi:MAG: pyridoxamine 5'-phosphate oxidase family protein [Halobacteriaceae archaeon]
MRVSGDWDEQRVRSYLEEAVVPVRLATHTPAGGPWLLSLWYRFRAGSLWCATHAAADVVEYIDADDRVAFEVSTNDPPYRGVRGAGRASVEPDPEKELLRALLDRYLGGAEGDLAEALLAPEREEVRIEIDPAKVYAWDFSDRMDEEKQHK